MMIPAAVVQEEVSRTAEVAEVAVVTLEEAVIQAAAEIFKSRCLIIDIPESFTDLPPPFVLFS